jgi:hypothetical protein
LNGGNQDDFSMNQNGSAGDLTDSAAADGANLRIIGLANRFNLNFHGENLLYI